MQTLLRNARIVDATVEEARPGNILIEDGVIRDVNAKAAAGDCTTIDAEGRTVMPGLIDSHVHVVASLMNLFENSQLPPAIAVLRSVPILKGMLERGFTTVRDLGGAPHSLAVAIEQGLTPGPRLFTCGKALSKTGGHSDARPRYDTHDANRLAGNFGALGRIADGVDEVRRACREMLREGASFIKVMANGGVASPTDPIHWFGYTVEELRAAVEEARDAHTYVAAHLYTAEGIERAVECGVRTLEHCNRVDAKAAQKAVAEGAIADLLVVEGDPLSDITVLADPAKNVRLVIKDGVVVRGQSSG